MLNINSLDFGYSKNEHILKDINLNIEPGEVVGLIGFNGSGKTTLIKLLMGILQPIKGDISINTLTPDISNNLFKKDVSVAFDKADLVDFLTVKQYLEHIIYIYKNYKDLNNVNLKNYIKDFGIESYENVLIKDLSHGTRKKVQLISTFISEPLIIILDEPTNGLDFESIITLEKLIKNKKDTQMVLIASHDFNFLQEVCNNHYVLKKGDLRPLILKENNNLRKEVIDIIKE